MIKLDFYRLLYAIENELRDANTHLRLEKRNIQDAVVLRYSENLEAFVGIMPQRLVGVDVANFVNLRRLVKDGQAVVTLPSISLTVKTFDKKYKQKHKVVQTEYWKRCRYYAAKFELGGQKVFGDNFLVPNKLTRNEWMNMV